MIVATKTFFDLIRIHHQLPAASRPADLTGRLSMMADGWLDTDPATQRRLRLFLNRRIQPSASNQSMA